MNVYQTDQWQCEGEEIYHLHSAVLQKVVLCIVKGILSISLMSKCPIIDCRLVEAY